MKLSHLLSGLAALAAVSAIALPDHRAIGGAVDASDESLLTRPAPEFAPASVPAIARIERRVEKDQSRKKDGKKNGKKDWK
ncbi:hypothetical protein ACHAQA_005983 [Verticillium albo-atrum]